MSALSGETSVERSFQRWCRARGIVCWKLNVPGETGVPDRIVFLPGGKLLLIEFKKPGAGVVSAKQGYWVDTLRSLGFEVEIHDSLAGATDFLRRVLAPGPGSKKRR